MWFSLKKIKSSRFTRKNELLFRCLIHPKLVFIGYLKLGYIFATEMTFINYLFFLPQLSIFSSQLCFHVSGSAYRSFCFRWFTCLHLCHEQILNLHSWEGKISTMLIKMVLATSGPVLFYMNFRINLIMSNSIGILTEIVLIYRLISEELVFSSSISLVFQHVI